MANEIHCPFHRCCDTYGQSVACLYCRRILKRFLIENVHEFQRFESIVFTGSSGAAFGYWLADELGVSPVQILKVEERGHGAMTRGELPHGGWLFLDDFVANGDTYRRVRAKCGRDPIGGLFYMPSFCAAGVMPAGTKIVYRESAGGAKVLPGVHPDAEAVGEHDHDEEHETENEAGPCMVDLGSRESFTVRCLLPKDLAIDWSGALPIGVAQ